MSGELLYRWTYIAPHSGKVMASAGLEVPASGLPSKDTEFDMLVVCGGLGAENYADERLFAFLRHSSRRGVIVGATSTATFVLARAGLLQDRRCTVHWDYLEAFQEIFPEVGVCDELLVVDRNVFTCAGGTAAMDAILHLVRRQQGDVLASLVADQFIHGQVRQADDSQRMAMRNRIGVSQPKVIKAIELMENLADLKFSATDIAKTVSVSTRQLERLFKRHLKTTPAKYHLKVRLARAQRLLQRTTLPVVEAAVVCGFTSASHFTKCYREQFGRLPSADRQAFSSFVEE